MSCVLIATRPFAQVTPSGAICAARTFARPAFSSTKPSMSSLHSLSDANLRSESALEATEGSSVSQRSHEANQSESTSLKQPTITALGYSACMAGHG